MNGNGMVVKDFGLKIKGLDIKNRIVEGYFSSFNTVDSDNEIIVKGAFSKSIAENGPRGKGRIKHLFNHFDTVGVLQELEEDDFGLRYVSKIGTHRLGEDVLKMIDEGLITEHSIGYRVIQSERDNGKGITTLKEVQLWEGSSLDKWGSNENTPILKTAGGDREVIHKVVEMANSIQLLLTKRTNFTDDTYSELVIKLATLQRILKSLETFEPSLESDTQNDNEPVKKNGNGSELIDYDKLITIITRRK